MRSIFAAKKPIAIEVMEVSGKTNMSQTIEEAPTRQERLNTLIANLAEYIELDNSIINQYGQELCAIYSEKDFRHSYAQISIEIEKLAPDQRDVLCANLESLKESVL